MKKTALLIIVLLGVPYVSAGDVYLIKLRSDFNKNSLRIVLEGPDEALSRAIVNQKDESIIVTIPDTVFTIQQDQSVVNYRKKGGDSVIFYPGDFWGLKVFNLKRPHRLVMDVYVTGMYDDKRRPYSWREGGEAPDDVVLRTIVIDPGHGGYDSGMVKGKNSEKNIVLDIAQKLGALLESNTTQAFLTRKIDQYMTQEERVSFASRKEPNIFLTLHVGNHSNVILYFPVLSGDVSDVINSHLYNRAQAEHMENSTFLLKAMREALRSAFGDDMVEVRPLPYSILPRIQAAALMVELPSLEDADYVKEFRVEVARSLYKGLYIYEEIKGP